jgi:CelD/BcsL family acetyltransferase involved in cellulose biosynthesis
VNSAALKLRDEELRVEIIEGRDAFTTLEREWNKALAQGPHDEPMLRHEWMRAFIENFAPGATLRVFAARTGRELQAAVPLIESRERSADTCFVPMTTWATPCNDHSQRGGVLLGRRGAEGLQAIWDKLVDTPGWDRLRIRDLPEGAPEWQLREIAERAGYPCGLWVSLRSPWLALPQKYEQVEAAVDGKFRQNLRRRKRRLAEQGEVKYALVDGKDEKQLDEALADFFTIEASGWKGRGGTAIALRPELVGFYTQIARDAAKRNALALGFLELAGKRIAAHLTIVHGGKSYLLKLGYDEKFHEFSPGQQLVSEALRDACARGLKEFDFLGPSMDWKLDWESASRTHTWLTIFRPTRAGVLVHGARYLVWPVLRALWRKGK